MFEGEMGSLDDRGRGCRLFDAYEMLAGDDVYEYC